MASMKAKIEIGLDSSKLKQGSKEATQSFDKMASGAKSAMGKIDSRADKSANKIKQVGTEGKLAGSKVKAGAEKGAQGMNKLGNEAKKAERDIGGVAISVLGLGASVTGLSDTIFGMKEKLVAIERSTFGLERTTEDMKRMQEDFDEAVKAGTMTAKEHERALKDLELGYKDMAVEQKEVLAEQEAMNSEWISFAVNTATTVVFSLTTITTALGVEGMAKVKNALTTNIATLANNRFVLSLWAIAKHPVFLIATAGLAIWESNLFGLRSEIEKWSGMEDLSLLSNLEKTFSSGIPDAGAETIDSLDNIEKKALELQETFDTTTTTSNSGIIPSIEEIGKCSDKTASKVDNLTDSLDELKKKRETEQADSVADEISFQHKMDRARRIGGKSYEAEAKRYYEETVYGNTTAGWTPQAMATLRGFKDRVSAQNAIFNQEAQARKNRQQQGLMSAYRFAKKWGITGGSGTFGNSDRRNIPIVVAQTKRRIRYLEGLGYGSISNPQQMAEAEAKLASDRQSWVADTGMTNEQVTQLQVSGRKHDIFNIINHRQRLGLITSGVI